MWAEISARAEITHVITILETLWGNLNQNTARSLKSGGGHLNVT